MKKRLKRTISKKLLNNFGEGMGSFVMTVCQPNFVQRCICHAGVAKMRNYAVCKWGGAQRGRKDYGDNW
jgi:hypothetical protein